MELKIIKEMPREGHRTELETVKPRRSRKFIWNEFIQLNEMKLPLAVKYMDVLDRQHL